MGAHETSKVKSLQDDRFQVRESPLKNAFDKFSAVRGTFSAIVTVLALMFAVMIIVYCTKPDVFYGDLAFVHRCFVTNFSAFLLQWVILHAALLLVAFPAIKHYVVSRNSSYIIHQVPVVTTFAVIVVVPASTILLCDLHPVLCLAVVAEQIRIIMKLIAYYVENSKNRQRFEEKCDLIEETPSLSSFVYFLFAPTLIYRHRYPLSNKPTNWKLVASYAAQILACMFLAVILIRHQLEPRFNVIGRRPLTIDDIAGILFLSIAFAWLVALAIGYAFLHAWLNIFAEILGFGDRLFYKDWFSSSDPMDFMRTWNFLMHAWIAEYVYKPVLRSTGSKPIPTFVVMAIAGLGHDYVFIMAGKFFLFYETIFIPIMLATHCWNQWMQHHETEVKSIAHTDKKPEMVTNVNMFIAIVFTNMLEFIVLTGEYYSVHACPRPETGWAANLFVPRLLSCPSFDLR